MKMANSFDFSMLWNAFGIFLSLVTFGVCVFYVFRKQTPDAFLLVGGSFIHLLSNAFYSLAWPMLIHRYGYSISDFSILMSIINVINIFGSILFTVGLIMLIMNYLSLNKKIEEQKIY